MSLFWLGLRLYCQKTLRVLQTIKSRIEWSSVKVFGVTLGGHEMAKKWRYLGVRLGVFVAAMVFVGQSARGQNCANPPVPTITSPQVPTDVCVPQGFSGNPIQFFDDYSWRTFIAMVWPVAAGQRGQPDTTKTVASPGPLLSSRMDGRVFETFKSVWETFHNDGSTPAAWNVYDAAKFNACSATASFGDIILSSFSKFSDLGQAGVGSLVGPLVAQNTTYVRYAAGFNETEFTQILGDQLYLRRNLPTPPNSLTFKNGSVDVKAAWILMDGIPHPERYYTRKALVLDPKTGNCSQTTVGLVGLHIVQKTSTRPQWIWTTFEQVDNVPPAVGGGPGTFNFNDGKGGAMPFANPYPIDPLLLPTPAPFNVQRVTPIHASTANTNTAYRNMLERSVWQFYQLVMTQWPLDVSQPGKPGVPANTFPGTGATSAFANVTMETFDQSKIQTGCMNCHNSTRLPTDFVWTLNDHASPTNVPDFLMRDTAFRELQTLMLSTSPQAQTGAK